MRRPGFLSICVLLSSLPCVAGPSCKVEVIFQRTPKRTAHLEQVLARAEAGDRGAQFQAGLAFETGNGGEQDYAAAVRWYRKAADQGDASAQNNLGGMFLRGLGVEQSDSEALRWYLRAAAEGYLPAQNNVGFMNAAGRGTKANDAEAVRWYERGGKGIRAGASQSGLHVFARTRGGAEW